MRSKAASTRRALVAGQLLTQYLERNIEGRRRQLALLDPIGDHLDSKSLGVTDGLFARRPVHHHTGQFQSLGNPAPVIFPIDLYRKLHSSIVRLSHIPGVIVQGRYDVVCPMESAWALHRAWHEAELIITPDSGHYAFDPPNTRALVAAADRFAG